MNCIRTKTARSILKMFHILSAISVTGGFLCVLVLLAGRNINVFTGNEIYYDKMILDLFNIVITYGALVMGITMFIYSALTEWRFLKHRFLILKWILVVMVFGIAWFIFGSAISGMASISDAGLHRSTMREVYISHWRTALLSTSIELVLLMVIVFISIRKPFGVRKVQPFKYQKLVVGILIPCIVLGIGFLIFGQVRQVKLRNTPIKDVELTNIQDGEYEGQSVFGSYTYHLKVKVKDHKITKVEDLAPRDSIYVTYASGVLPRIVDKQTPNVDAITGATTTSKAFMKAVEDALEKAK